jgi:hypothetical protein
MNNSSHRPSKFLTHFFVWYVKKKKGVGGVAQVHKVVSRNPGTTKKIIIKK